MVRVSTTRTPVSVPLKGRYGEVTVTLNRLTSPHFAEARQAAQALLADDAKLLVLLAEHELLPEGGVRAWKRMKEDDPIRYAAFVSGVGIWLGAVECGLRGVMAWTGIVGEDEGPAPIDRATLEVLMLDEDFRQQVMDELDAAAKILVVEGKP